MNPKKKNRERKPAPSLDITPRLGTSPPRNWHVWAATTRDRKTILDVGTRIYIQAHYTAEHLHVAPAYLREDPQGPYHAWLGADGEFPSQIWRSRAALELCFPHGLQAEVLAGKGEYIRLTYQAYNQGQDAPLAAGPKKRVKKKRRVSHTP